MLLLAAAVLLRVAVPQGYMVEGDADSGLRVTICGSNAEWVIPTGESDSSHPDKPVSNGGDCYFSAHAAAADTPADAVQPPVFAVEQRHALPLAKQLPIGPSARALPPARAPPHTA